MSTIVQIKAIPKSRVSNISIDKTGKLCVRLTSAPENGKANQEIIKLIAQKLKIPLADVEIISGLTTRLKRIKIIGTYLNEEELISKLLPFRQQRLF